MNQIQIANRRKIVGLSTDMAINAISVSLSTDIAINAISVSLSTDIAINAITLLEKPDGPRDLASGV